MSLSNTLCVSMYAGILACLNSTVIVQVPQMVPYSNVPLLTATAEAPKTVKKLTTFTYAVSVTDADDYWYQGNGHIQVADPTSKIRPNAITSMTNRSSSFRGQIGSTFTYDVVGTAVNAPGTYRDSYTGYNDRVQEIDRLYDSGLAFNQTVIVTE